MNVRYSLALGALVTACGGSETAPKQAEMDLKEPVVMESQSQKTLAAVAELVAAMDAGDVDAYEKRLAEDAQFFTMDGINPEAETREQHVSFQRKIIPLMPDQKVTPLVMLANGNRSVVLMHFDSGTTPRLSIIDATVFEHGEDGRVTVARGYGDSTTALHQIGVRKNKESPDSETAWEETFRAASTGSAEEAANLARVAPVFEADAAGNIDALGALIHDDFVFRVFPEKNEIRGSQAFLAMMKGRAQALTPEYKIVSSWAAGDWVVAELEATFNFKAGALAGKKAASKSLMLSRSKEGKAVATYLLFNATHMAIQLGALTEKEFREKRGKALELLMKNTGGSK